MSTFLIRVDDIQAEEDSNEIAYTKAEIAAMKKRDAKFAMDELP